MVHSDALHVKTNHYVFTKKKKQQKFLNVEIQNVMIHESAFYAPNICLCRS